MNHITRHYKNLAEQLENQLNQLIEIIKEATKQLDPVGEEDSDINNDGERNDEEDEFILKRRKKISQAIRLRGRNK